MSLFNRKKKQPEPQSVTRGIIYNATHYTLDDHPFAPKRKHFDLAIVETNGVLSLEPITPVTPGREKAYKEAVEYFKKAAFGSTEVPQDIEVLKQKVKRILWCAITIY